MAQVALSRAYEVLRKYFGYTSFREGQQKALEFLLEGQDTLAIMPTGAGKSLAYQIPALLFEGLTLVISPLISLMKDQVDALEQAGVPATFINSTLSPNEVAKRIQQVQQGNYKLLYIAPERLDTENLRSMLEPISLSFVAVDEAHCVSQWGHDFRPSYVQIPSFIQSLPVRPLVGAFTATATEEVKEDIIRLLGLKTPRVLVTGFDRPNLAFSALRGENKREYVLGYLKANPDQSGIIYAATRKEVDNLADFLNKKGVAAAKYHAGLSDQARQQSQDDFLFDRMPVMVATNAFGMGIDKSNVRFVIHYNMPKNMEAYYQEAGRAGRDGEKAECILLFSPADVQLQKYLIEQTTFNWERKQYELKRLQTMADYCHTGRCLRQAILQYFGEENVPEYCGNCSSCNDQRETVDITEDAQKIFSCVYRMRERFGATLVAGVLKGSANKKVRELGFDKLSTYGIMHQVPTQEIKDRINYLIAEGYLRLAGGEYPVVKLEAKAVPVLKGQDKVWQKVTPKPVCSKGDAEDLFERLRRLRLAVAQREKLPPYMIFADSTLREMAQSQPMDSKDLIHVNGVGERKLEKYGEEFLQEIHRFVEERGGTEEQGGRVPAAESGDEKTASHLITLKQYLAGNSLEEIARNRKLSVITLQRHLERCATEGYDVPWDDFIPEGQEALVLEAVRQVGAERLKPIKEALPEEVGYFTIRAVLCKQKKISL